MGNFEIAKTCFAANVSISHPVKAFTASLIKINLIFTEKHFSCFFFCFIKLALQLCRDFFSAQVAAADMKALLREARNWITDSILFSDLMQIN